MDEKEKKICGNCLFARKYEDWIYKCEKSRRFTSEKDTCKNWAPANEEWEQSNDDRKWW